MRESTAKLLLSPRQRVVLARHSMRIEARRGVVRSQIHGDYYELLVSVGNGEQICWLTGSELALPVSDNELAHMIWLAEASRRAILQRVWRPTKPKRKLAPFKKSKTFDLIQSFRHKTRAQTPKPDE